MFMHSERAYQHVFLSDVGRDSCDIPAEVLPVDEDWTLDVDPRDIAVGEDVHEGRLACTAVNYNAVRSIKEESIF